MYIIQFINQETGRVDEHSSFNRRVMAVLAASLGDALVSVRRVRWITDEFVAEGQGYIDEGFRSGTRYREAVAAAAVASVVE